MQRYWCFQLLPDGLLVLAGLSWSHNLAKLVCCVGRGRANSDTKDRSRAERGLHAQLLLAYIRYIQNLSQTINLDYLGG